MEGKVAHVYKYFATFHEEVKPGDRLEMDAQVIFFKRGLFRGVVKGYVDGKIVCEMEAIITVPEIFTKFRPKKPE